MISKEERQKDRAICEAAPEGPWAAVEVERGGGWESALRLPSGAHVFGIPSTMVPFVATARDRLPVYVAALDTIEERMATIEALTRGDDSAESKAAAMVLRILRGGQ